MSKSWTLSLALGLVFVQVLTVLFSIAAKVSVFPVLQSMFEDYGTAFPKMSIIYFLYIDPYAFLLPIVFLIAFVALLRNPKYEELIPPIFASGAILCCGLLLYAISAYGLPMFMASVWGFEKLVH